MKNEKVFIGIIVILVIVILGMAVSYRSFLDEYEVVKVNYDLAKANMITSGIIDFRPVRAELLRHVLAQSTETTTGQTISSGVKNRATSVASSADLPAAISPTSTVAGMAKAERYPAMTLNTKYRTGRLMTADLVANTRPEASKGQSVTDAKNALLRTTPSPMPKWRSKDIVLKLARLI